MILNINELFMASLRRGQIWLGLLLIFLASCAWVAPVRNPVATAAAPVFIPATLSPANQPDGTITTAENGRELHVAKTGNDNADGSLGNPWLTLQHAVSQALPGDRILVHAGDYVGCRIERSGTPDLPITLQAAPGELAVISAPGAENKHQSNIEIEAWEGDGRVAHWIISGFEVRDAPGWGIDSRGSEEGHNQAITIRANRVHQNGLNSGKTGIFAAFSDYVLIENNESFANGEHGIYVNNSSDNFTIRGNHIHDNAAAGIHLNGDASFGGDGMMSNGTVGENRIHDNGIQGGAAINMDGVEDTLVLNNLLYRNHASGIAIFQQDGAACSRRNRIWFNTVLMPADGRWALIINGPDCADNQVFNNIFLSDHVWRGSINIANGQAPGLQSDFNIVSDRFTIDDGGTILSLAGWQVLGYDANSFIGTADELFTSAANDDNRLRPGSPAIDTGKVLPAVTADIRGVSRPAGAGYDIGAYEFPEDTGSAVLWLPVITAISDSPFAQARMP
jgi:parallel beta-helix repeat protein